ncbi:acetyltransferase (GNAT) family protein [Pseudoduganella lurida]|uniref:Acetyltransferase (GNAT) family protein n=1 Tax=Pseudoduganella lurida TaxID=1036180 RepID=A0A562QXQ7_9BURK|nr:GNAT family N-acetyltransferase [Pseudoduganella lurida]TWI61582.1 acetyltransferase (GNAT) family protein [Pseudoduganella lurida]
MTTPPTVDLALLERWLACWSLARGLPLPRREDGGLVVDVGWSGQLRRHVFVDAGPALQACAAGIDAPFVYLKAAVMPQALRDALPHRWVLEQPRYLMHRAEAMSDGQAIDGTAPAGYTLVAEREHGAAVLRLADADGMTAASGRIVLNSGTAVFDRIETHAAHRRRGLARALMFALDARTAQADVRERLLVATEAGRTLYERLGWRVLAPYSTAVLPAGA